MIFIYKKIKNKKIKECYVTIKKIKKKKIVLFRELKNKGIY